MPPSESWSFDQVHIGSRPKPPRGNAWSTMTTVANSNLKKPNPLSWPTSASATVDGVVCRRETGGPGARGDSATSGATSARGINGPYPAHDEGIHSRGSNEPPDRSVRATLDGRTRSFKRIRLRCQAGGSSVSGCVGPGGIDAGDRCGEPSSGRVGRRAMIAQDQ